KPPPARSRPAILSPSPTVYGFGHETDISAQQNQASSPSRFPCADVHSGGSRDHQRPTCQGPQASGRQPGSVSRPANATVAASAAKLAPARRRAFQGRFRQPPLPRQRVLPGALSSLGSGATGHGGIASGFEASGRSQPPPAPDSRKLPPLAQPASTHGLRCRGPVGGSGCRPPRPERTTRTTLAAL